MCNKSNTIHPSRAPPAFSGVRVVRSLVFCVMIIVFFCPFSFGHCIVCPTFVDGFWLPLCYLQTPPYIPRFLNHWIKWLRFIQTKVVSSISTGEVYSIGFYVMNFWSDMRKISQNTLIFSTNDHHKIEQCNTITSTNSIS